MSSRAHFHDDLKTLELDILAMGEEAERAVGLGVQAMASEDSDEAERVIAGDDLIDQRYLSVERRTLELLALQTPVASDLRLISAILHMNLHLERMGDIAVNIAKITRVTMGLPRNLTIVSHLQEMSDIVRPMVRTAIEAFARRDLAAALRLPDMDEPADRLNKEMYREVGACASDPGLLEWAVHMMVVSRQLERVGDHAVDIAEQVAFVITGEFREFNDASHPLKVQGAK